MKNLKWKMENGKWFSPSQEGGLAVALSMSLFSLLKLLTNCCSAFTIWLFTFALCLVLLRNLRIVRSPFTG
jgi:hypothetical protein